MSFCEYGRTDTWGWLQMFCHLSSCLLQMSVWACRILESLWLTQHFESASLYFCPCHTSEGAFRAVWLPIAARSHSQVQLFPVTHGGLSTIWEHRQLTDFCQLSNAQNTTPLIQTNFVFAFRRLSLDGRCHALNIICTLVAPRGPNRDCNAAELSKIHCAFLP